MDTVDELQRQLDTVGDCLRWAQTCFEDARLYYGHGTDNAWDEALHLVFGGLKLSLESDPSLLDTRLIQAEKTALIRLVQRRIEERIPVPYLTGRVWFAGLEFKIDRRAIIPRSPIAELIEQEFSPWYAGQQLQRVLDMCCGSGCIGLAVAAWLPETRVDLVDLDVEALDLARENAALLGLQQRVEILQSDFFQALRGRQYDLVISNPPYVDLDDLQSMPAEYAHEPTPALGSGGDGLDAIRLILSQAAHFLAPDGLLVAEVGNSWRSLEQAFPRMPFTWIELERGGHGVFVLTAQELVQGGESLA
ncbi:MAG: 50S ribosomal protein L3 N(5)-glutamine methyltransferase [Gammaproteobacteria bacterium]|nr:50S ribosomal protein L3 N(5)-glutamine methyltransferase [Gammaproteobacteria bacterium]